MAFCVRACPLSPRSTTPGVDREGIPIGRGGLLVRFYVSPARPDSIIWWHPTWIGNGRYRRVARLVGRQEQSRYSEDDRQRHLREVVLCRPQGLLVGGLERLVEAASDGALGIVQGVADDSLFGSQVV
jgi:hypothetical protein